MTNIDWDKFHKDIPIDKKVDPDLEKFLKRFYMSDKGNKDVLDIGCGQGGNTAYMSYFYKNWTCRACDYSAKALCIVNSGLKKRSNVKLKQCNADNTGYNDNQFDLVIDVALLASVGDFNSVFREVNRILKPRGKVFIKEISTNECNTDNKYIGRGEAVNRYSEKDLYDAMKDNGFDKIEVSKYYDEKQNIEHIVCIGRKK